MRAPLKGVNFCKLLRTDWSLAFVDKKRSKPHVIILWFSYKLLLHMNLCCRRNISLDFLGIFSPYKAIAEHELHFFVIPMDLVVMVVVRNSRNVHPQCQRIRRGVGHSKKRKTVYVGHISYGFRPYLVCPIASFEDDVRGRRSDDDAME